MIQSLGYGIKGDYNAAYAMSIRDGQLRKVAQSPLRNGIFVTNHRHEVELVYGVDLAGDNEVYRRASPDAPWELVFEHAAGKGWTAPMGAAENGFIVLDSSASDTDSVYLWRPGNALERIYTHPDVDVSDLTFDPSGRLWLLTIENHFPDYHYPDPAHPLAVLHQKLRAKFPDDNVAFPSMTDDLGIVIVYVSGTPQLGHLLCAGYAQERDHAHAGGTTLADARSTGRDASLRIQRARRAESAWFRDAAARTRRQGITNDRDSTWRAAWRLRHLRIRR
ncbi:MAG: hypothetical protein HC809_07095 [Gammaproteobacteria bacterium]|nr:hypothetical protein [Gammaproteobacteria bacterium]